MSTSVSKFLGEVSGDANPIRDEIERCHAEAERWSKKAARLEQFGAQWQRVDDLFKSILPKLKVLLGKLGRNGVYFEPSGFQSNGEGWVVEVFSKTARDATGKANRDQLTAFAGDADEAKQIQDFLQSMGLPARVSRNYYNYISIFVGLRRMADAGKTDKTATMRSA